MLTKRDETGIEELRRVVRAASMCRESAFDGFSAEECVRMIRACWTSKWDVLPDDLLPEERYEAAATGKLPEEAEARLDAEYDDGESAEEAIPSGALIHADERPRYAESIDMSTELTLKRLAARLREVSDGMVACISSVESLSPEVLAIVKAERLRRGLP